LALRRLDTFGKYTKYWVVLAVELVGKDWAIAKSLRLTMQMLVPNKDTSPKAKLERGVCLWSLICLPVEDIEKTKLGAIVP